MTIGAEEYWLSQVKEYVHESKHIVLVGNKADLLNVLIIHMSEARKVKYIDALAVA